MEEGKYKNILEETDSTIIFDIKGPEADEIYTRSSKINIYKFKFDKFNRPWVKVDAIDQILNTCDYHPLIHELMYSTSRMEYKVDYIPFEKDWLVFDPYLWTTNNKKHKFYFSISGLLKLNFCHGGYEGIDNIMKISDEYYSKDN